MLGSVLLFMYDASNTELFLNRNIGTLQISQVSIYFQILTIFILIDKILWHGWVKKMTPHEIMNNTVCKSIWFCLQLLIKIDNNF